MRRPCILVFSLALVGCATSKQQPSPSLTDAQATQMATRLANNQADYLFHCQPFHDGRPANFTNGHWRWTQLCSGDYEATVELAANGSTNRVVVLWLNDGIGIP
jgi:hypothetical protein